MPHRLVWPVTPPSFRPSRPAARIGFVMADAATESTGPGLVNPGPRGNALLRRLGHGARL